METVKDKKKWKETIWTDEEIQYLKDNYVSDGKVINNIAERFGRTYRGVQLKASRLGLSKSKQVMTEEQCNYVREHYVDETDDVIAEKLNLNKETVFSFRKRNKLLKTDSKYYSSKKPVKWTEEEVKFLIENYSLLSYFEISKELGRTRKSVERKALNLNLGLKGGTYMRGHSISSIEQIVKDFLDEQGITYKCEKRISTFYVDFYIPKANLCIEVQGDFWHCNPKVFKKPVSRIQTRALERDARKKELIIAKGYSFLEVWEYDLIHDLEVTKSTILETISSATINHVNCGKPLKRKKLKRKVESNT